MPQWFNGPGEDLATVARETGYPVVEVDGWRNRGHGGLDSHVGVIVLHHTAGPKRSASSENFPSLRVVRDGRAGLPGPLAHFGIGYDGTLYVVAAGLAYHAGSGGWAGMSGNGAALGIEAENSGDGDWTDAQLDVYPRLCAVLCQFLGVDSAAVCAHREWAPNRKIDPAGIDMPDFRRTVSDYLATPDQITAQEDDMRDDERQALFDILQQHTGSRTPGEFPGWPSFVDDSERFTMLDYLRNVDAHTYHGRNLSRESIRDTVRKAMAEIDPAKVNAETIVDLVAERLAPDSE